MSPSAAARIGFVEKTRIGMCTEYHVASSIDNAIIQIGGQVVGK
jgi:hypothetical protein